MPENNTPTEPRYVPAEAAYIEPTTGQNDVAWGVYDRQEDRFAPFGGSEELAHFAAQRIEEKPWLPWSFLSTFVLATN